MIRYYCDWCKDEIIGPSYYDFQVVLTNKNMDIKDNLCKHCFSRLMGLRADIILKRIDEEMEMEDEE